MHKLKNIQQMKHTLILLALCALFASCNNGGDCAQLKKENDSLRNLLSKGANTPALASAVNPGGGGNPVIINNADLIDTTDAITEIGKFNTIVESKNLGKWKTRAFIIKIGDIDSIKAHYCNQGCAGPECTALLVYPAADQNDSLTILFSPLSGQPNNYTALYPLKQPGGHGQIFDHTLPCPECGITGGLLGINMINPKNDKSNK